MRAYYLGAVAAVSALLATTFASAYNDDYFNSSYPYPDAANKMREYHSTFHYEFTRTLLRAAGYTANEAEQAAVTCEATDWQLYYTKSNSALLDSYFIGYTGLKVGVNNTSRKDYNQARFWHFPRRASTTSSGAVTYPLADVSGVKSNTCDYFSTSNKCADSKKPELSIIDDWALNGNSKAISSANLTGVSTPTIAVNGGTTQAAGAGSLYALGIYLHSLGDSYSHEACMKTNQFNYHPEQESKDASTYSASGYPQCSSENVHGNFRASTEVAAAEFNGGNSKLTSYPNNNPTLPWTKAAGRAVYAVARAYASKWFSGTRAEAWSETDRNTFIDQFAAQTTSTNRASCALKAWDSLGKSETKPPSCP